MDRVYERIISGEDFMTQLSKGMSVVTAQNYGSQEVDEEGQNILLTDIVTPRVSAVCLPGFRNCEA